MILILLIPIALLTAIVAWLSWRARHPQVALTMAGISLLCSGLSVVTIVAGVYFYEVLEKSLG